MIAPCASKMPLASDDGIPGEAKGTANHYMDQCRRDDTCLLLKFLAPKSKRQGVPQPVALGHCQVS